MPPRPLDLGAAERFSKSHAGEKSVLIAAFVYEDFSVWQLGLPPDTRRLNEYVNEIINRFPQARDGSYWLNEQTEQALKALDQTVAEFNGDAQRLYLAGHSLGGYGTYTTAVLYPNKFAALVPVAGGIVPPNELSPFMKLFIPKPILAILNAANPYDALAEKLGDAPVWIFHGAADESISVKESRNIAAALKKNGSKNAKYTEYAETNRNDGFVKAFSDPKLYKWLGKQTLKTKAVSPQTSNPRVGKNQ